MKLSCFEMLVGERPLAEKFAMVRDAGFDGIDLRGDLVHGHVDEVRAAGADTGIPVAAVYGRLDPLLAATAAARTAALELLRGRLRDARAVGAATLVVVPVFGRPLIDVDLGRGVEDVEWSLLGVLLKEILADGSPDGSASGSGGDAVTIVIEPLNARETHLVRSPSQAAAFTRRVGDSRLATMIDTYHADLEGQDAVAEIDAVGDQLALVHLSDRDRTLPGRGGLDFGPSLRRLVQRGYAGWAGFECTGPFGVPALATSVAHVRELAGSGA